ncbi:hypothetical protein CHH28_07150 [Bacterioplanes sanyensis]|uniref:Uncharacterized protein n=1 Tax=Bacterioplanes sanyensis TaxID=1249553 RepID=A0A222FJ62_9GAMM|nr:hypothetical protein [Bacterioplanes sanyensis]ASP38461.1 hypothetical protein CHH28_07150 [Bacterioplanes sanyensis]
MRRPDTFELRGHMMFTSTHVASQHTRCTELGRSDKTRPLDGYEYIFDDADSASDDVPVSASAVAQGDSNARWRCADQFHQVGAQFGSMVVTRKGSVDYKTPSWGLVSRFSNVHSIDMTPVSHPPNGQLIADHDSVRIWWTPRAESYSNESYLDEPQLGMEKQAP